MFRHQLNAYYNRIEEGLSVIDKPYLSCSWGKDSVFVLWLLRNMGVSIPIIYMNSGYALPDTLLLRDRLLAEWDLSEYYTELPPASDYFDIVRTFGLPDIDRTPANQKKVVDVLKKKNANDFAALHGFTGNLWGIRADESRARRQFFKRYGYMFRAKIGLHRLAPIIDLSTRELWQMIDYYAIPYSTVYDKTLFFPREQIRNAGWMSTDGAQHGRISWLRYYYPSQFNMLCHEFPIVRSYL